MNYELQNKLYKLHSLMHKWNIKTRASKGVMGDVYRGQGRILEFLKIVDGISTRDLSYFLGMGISSLNELLAKLEKSELITREQSSEDKRVMLIYLTDKGRAQEEQSEENDMFSTFTVEEQAHLDNYFERLIDYFISELGNTEEYEDVKKWEEEIIGRIGNEEFRRIIKMNNGRCGHGRGRHGHQDGECCGQGRGKHEHRGECGSGEHRRARDGECCGGEGHGHNHGENCQCENEE